MGNKKLNRLLTLGTITCGYAESYISEPSSNSGRVYVHFCANTTGKDMKTFFFIFSAVLTGFSCLDMEKKFDSKPP